MVCGLTSQGTGLRHSTRVTSSDYVVCGLTSQGTGLRHSTRVTSSDYVVCGLTSQGTGLRHSTRVTSSDYVVCGLTSQGTGLRHSTRVTSSDYVVCGLTSQGAGLRHPDHDSVDVGVSLLGRVPAKTVNWRKCRSLLLILLPPPGTLRPSQNGPSSGHLFDLSADRWMPCV